MLNHKQSFIIFFSEIENKKKIKIKLIFLNKRHLFIYLFIQKMSNSSFDDSHKYFIGMQQNI